MDKSENGNRVEMNYTFVLYRVTMFVMTLDEEYFGFVFQVWTIFGSEIPLQFADI